MVLAFVLWYSVVYFASFVSSTQAIECQGTARYTLTFRAEWRSQTHPNFPSGPHFSRLVGCSHKADYVMWTPGIKATTGVEHVAEFGGTTALNTEMQNAITSKSAYKKYQGRGISGGTGTSSISNIEVNTEYPLVSFITMIAPSPDWFVGVHDFNLCNTTTGKWEDSRTRDLPPYDAGTDSGTLFQSNNIDTNPPENIHLLTNNTEGSFKGNKPVRRFGTFAFVKTYDSNTVIKPSSTMQQSPTPNVSAKRSSIMIDPKESSSTPSSTMQQSPTPNINAKSSAIMIDPKESSSTPSSTMQQSPTPNVNARSSSIIIDPKESTTPSSTMQQSPPTMQIQPSAGLNSKSSKHTVDPKEPSTRDMKNTLNPNVATQTLSPTATVTATASVRTTPTFTTTSAACSVKQFGFIHAVFAMILVNFCL